MKKVLFATTALIATAGVASADITLSGSAAAGLRYVENRTATNNNASDTVFDNEIDFTISASGQSDNGISFGASIDFENTETDQAESHTGANDGETFISFQGITITTGDVGNQTQSGIADVGYQGTGADDLAEQADVGNYDLSVAFSAGGLSFGVSNGSDTEDFALSVSGSTGAVSWGISSTNVEAGNDIIELTAGYSTGAYTLNGLYADVSGQTAAADLKAYGLSVAYAMGATTYTFAMSDTNADNQDANYGVGFSTNLGGGLSFAGGITNVGATTAGGEGTTQADLGFNMAF
ncbi:porin [Rhodobacterales bacterium FZCC0069]|nr:porin [Rhodobacterales bacterium FZCC0069]